MPSLSTGPRFAPDVTSRLLELLQRDNLTPDQRRAVHRTLMGPLHRTDAPPAMDGSTWGKGHAHAHGPDQRMREADHQEWLDHHALIMAAPERVTPPPPNHTEMTSQTLHAFQRPARLLEAARSQATPVLKRVERHLRQHGVPVPKPLEADRPPLPPNYNHWDDVLPDPDPLPDPRQARTPEEFVAIRCARRAARRAGDTLTRPMDLKELPVADAPLAPAPAPQTRRDGLIRQAWKYRLEHAQARAVAEIDDRMCSLSAESDRALWMPRLNQALDEWARVMRRQGLR